ncbi:MAG: tetratricopeptide repeat protein [Gemmatimonadota bacterium]
MAGFDLPARWDEVDAILSEALERPVDERLSYVRGRTADDPELGNSVEELLRAEAEATSFLERPIDLSSETWLEASDEFFARRQSDETDGRDHVGRTIGAWRIERELGRGGMARVFLAERTSGGFDQRAALKLLRSDLDDDIVRRFRDERQILSNLSHPNIARLLDGGSTDDGQPYLVMEAVDGLPITEWCDRRRLPIGKRLELFRRVLSAVQYAHANLVVHRDLKASNIMVTPDGRVKLLDFGIARILNPDDAGNDTRSSRLLLTPDCASPEQVTGDSITTASDTYQLGLLLYRLLTGDRPYEVASKSRSHLRDAIVGADPKAPSRAAAEADPVVAETRRTSARRLARELRGDLDAIILRCLRKDPADRYADVGELDTDLENYLASLPVEASGGGRLYRARKYFGRHPWALPALTAVAIAGVAYASVQHSHERGLEVERNVARAEAARAEAVKDFLVDLFRSADPWSSPDPETGRNITVRAALATGAERARAELAEQPRIKSELLAAIADVYASLSLRDEALPLLEEALQTARSADPEDPVITTAVLLQLGRVLNDHGRGDTARIVLNSALEAAEGLEPPHDTARATALGLLGSNARALNDFEAAESYYLRADSLILEHDGATPEQRAGVQHGLTNVYSTMNRLPEARAAAELQIELLTRALGPDAPPTAAALVRLADVLDMSGEDEASIPIYRKAVDILERALGEDHNSTLSTLNNLAVTLNHVGRTSESISVLRRVLEMRTRGAGIWDSNTADAMQNLSAVLKHAGELEEAEELLARAHRIYVAVLPEGDARPAFPLLTRSSIELQREAYSDAEATSRKALGILQTGLPAEHPATAMARCRLGRALLGRGRHAAAEPYLREGTRVAADATRLPPEYRAECLEGLALLLEATGRRSEAQPYRTALAELASDTVGAPAD